MQLFATILLLVLSSFEVFANTNPIVENVAFTISGTTVTVTYDLKDGEQTSVTIRMYVSDDSGTTWDYDYGEATGDIGTVTEVTSDAEQKTITWTYSGSSSSTFKIKIIADDERYDGSPCDGVATIVYEGKTYHTIQIGTQCWLKENLDIGTMITSDGDHSGTQQTENGLTEKYCYNNDANNCATYGGLYEWGEAVQYENGASNTTSPSPAYSGNVQGICPNGWHIPSEAEYKTLQINVDYKAVKIANQGMSNGLTATNTSGFSAIFTGYREQRFGAFKELGYETYVWSSTQSNNNFAGFISLYYDSSPVAFSNYYKNFAFSVRCLKD